MDENVVREQLVALLKGQRAHVSAEHALEGLDPKLRTARPSQGVKSVWEELEHMRIAQEDILRFTRSKRAGSPRSGRKATGRRSLRRSTMPNGNRRCRQILLVADHNAYHAGQIVQVRKALGAWRGEGIAMTRATKAQLVLLRQLVSLY